MSQAIAFDKLAVGSPLPLELRQRRGVHHGAGGLKLMDVHVYQARLPPPVKQKDLISVSLFNFAQHISQIRARIANKVFVSHKWIIAFAYLGGILLDIVSIPILGSLEP